MLVEQLIRETLEMQGFRIETVDKKGCELIVTIAPDLRYHPRCGVCGTAGDYRDTLSASPVPDARLSTLKACRGRQARSG